MTGLRDKFLAHSCEDALVNSIEDTYVINLSYTATALGISGTVVSEDAGIRGKVLPVRVRSPASGSTGDRWGNYCEVR